jgi:hypothetical protein
MIKARLPLRERDVQRQVVRLYESFRCIVYSTANPRRTFSTPGIPDLLVFSPVASRFWLHEVKAERGRVSDEQRAFEELCGSCGVGHVLGGVEEAKRHLQAIGLMARVGVA